MLKTVNCVYIINNVICVLFHIIHNITALISKYGGQNGMLAPTFYWG